MDRRKLLIVSLPALFRPGLGRAAGGFQPGKPSDYPSFQRIGPLEVAAVKYESDAEVADLFGKVNPNEYGVLPVLLILENKGKETVMLDRMRVLYQFKSQQVEPAPPSDLPYLAGGPKRPNTGPRYPVPIPLPKKKNPLAAVEFETRAFGAKTLLPGEVVHGFFYFEARHQKNAFLYITGWKEGTRDLFFAEVPLDSPKG